ncbi:aquaporin-10 [Pteropus vampyrus]|uniref:Aquaporin-10 n=1 Tax=Pteropus vampyrus TaxID=132908 RepID=A0A6P3QXT0_PTEVA|nr:aquaporin-10 [Pteropus vampyrus]
MAHLRWHSALSSRHLQHNPLRQGHFLTQGAVAQTVTSRGAKGNFFTSFLAGALAVTAAIYVGGNVSGAHLNPAFSLSMCLLGRLPWAKLPIYSLVQVLSAFCASGATYIMYYDALQNYTGGNLTVTGPLETASIFATYPASYLSLTGGFLDQVLGTWILLVGILALLDLKNKGVPAGLEPVAVGLLILAIELAMGSNCGVPLNPARDLGPRLFTYVAGWGPEVFRWEMASPGEGKDMGRWKEAPVHRMLPGPAPSAKLTALSLGERGTAPCGGREDPFACPEGWLTQT